MKKHIIYSIALTLLCTFMPGAVAADRVLECKTPPVTQAFIQEMDEYMRLIEAEFIQFGVPNCGKEGRMTLFGVDFYPDVDPTKQEKKEGDYFADMSSGISMAFSQVADAISLSTSSSTSFKEFTYSFSSTVMSHALYMDIQEVNKRFRTMEALMARTRYRCAEYIVNASNPTAPKTSRYVDVKAHYMAYRQLYNWLLSADQIQIPDTERAMSRSTSTDTEYQASLNVLAKSYLKLLQVGSFFADTYNAQGLDLALTSGGAATSYSVNPFHTQEYVGGIFSECQAAEIGANQIDASVRNVQNAMDAVAQTMQDTGNLLEETRQQYAQAFDTFVTDPVKATQQALKVRTDFTANLKIIIQSNYELYTAATEAETASRRMTNRATTARGASGPTLPARTTQQIASEVTGAGGTITDISRAATQENARVAAERQQNLHEYYVQLMNNNSGELTNQLYLSQLNAINENVLGKLTKELSESANTLSRLCKAHMPKAGEDCGELPKP